jgi:hypothetical protein
MIYVSCGLLVWTWIEGGKSTAVMRPLTVLLLLCSFALAQEPRLIAVSKAGVFHIVLDLDVPKEIKTITEFTAADTVLWLGVNNPQPPPPPTGVKEKLVALSKSKLRLKSDAATLAVILEKAKSLDPDEAEGAVERSIAALNVIPTVKVRLIDWHESAIELGKYTTTFLDMCLQALKEAWEIDLSRARPVLQKKQAIRWDRKPGEPLFDTTIETSLFK